MTPFQAELSADPVRRVAVMPDGRTVPLWDVVTDQGSYTTADDASALRSGDRIVMRAAQSHPGWPLLHRIMRVVP